MGLHCPKGTQRLTHLLAPTPLPATTANIAHALDYLRSLTGEGGTMMIEGIKAALDFPHDPERLRFVCFLTDGYINLAILNYKTEKDADVGAHGPNFSGIHHFGFEVENLDAACEKLDAAQGQRLTQKDNLDTMMAPGSHRNFEMKWAGPDGVVLDVSHTGWDGTSPK